MFVACGIWCLADVSEQTLIDNLQSPGVGP